ncbi:MAG: succinylglutamate desuccinylase/aspartoacylase family protein [Gammaproteobacteria bacterium]|nr:MAG: succinylglutamate desuccinylase/aspartoacylase family protein [Gammaproteobacteria bacterium]
MHASQDEAHGTAASRRRASLLLVFVALSALGLSGCEPSPASQALAAQQREAAAAAETGTPELITRAAATLPDPDAARVTEPGPGDPAPRATGIESIPRSDSSGAPSFGPGTPTASAATEDEAGGLTLLGQTIPAGMAQRLTWSASQIFEGVSSEAPVLVVNGRGEGPTLCLTAAIHGDELNGIEMVRRVLHDLDPEKMHGAIIGIPIVNLQGFRRGSRYLPDRRDLNRYFPGNPTGSSAARIAHSLFDGIIRHCDALVDLHTGSFFRTNLPQLRADLRYAQIKELTLGFGGIAVLHSEAARGTLRRAATDAGIPAITLEAGEPLRLQSGNVSQGVTGIFSLLDMLGIVNRVQLLAAPEPVYYQSTWVRADNGGILFSVVRLGQSIAVGDVLGTVTDPITNEQNLIYSPAKGRILGMALNQVVQPGFAAFRIGIETEGPPTESLETNLALASKKRTLGDGNVSATQTDSSSPTVIDQDSEEPSE